MKTSNATEEIENFIDELRMFGAECFNDDKMGSAQTVAEVRGVLRRLLGVLRDENARECRWYKNSRD